MGTGGVTTNASLLTDIVDFFENPVNSIVNAFDMDIVIQFDNVGGHFELAVEASAEATYSVSIYASDTVAGVGVSEDISLGLVFFLDLVFSLSAEVNLTAGFEVNFPPGSYLTVDPLDGSVVAHDL